jgi:hypothetical protein
MEELTPDWFTAALAPSFPGIQVRSAVAEPINVGVAMTLRVKLGYDGQTEDQYPASVCVKCCFGSPHSLVMRGGGLYTKEAYMYRHVLPDLKVNVPRSFASGYDDETNAAYILLEDQDLVGSQFCSADKSLTVEQVSDLVGQLAELHAKTWNGRWLHEKRWLHHGIPLGESDPVYDLYTDRIPEFLRMPRGGVVPRHYRDPRGLRDAVYELLALDGKAVPCLVHGDAHTGNLFIDGTGRPGYADWQCARAGHWSIDVAKTVMSALDPYDRRAAERDLLRQYLDRRSSLGIPAEDFDSAWDAYRRHAIFGLWIWLVTPPDMQTELRVTATVYKFGVAALDLDALGALR